MTNPVKSLGLSLLVVGVAAGLHAQGTAFTYQGRLDGSNSPVTGNYDFTFSIYDLSTGPGLVAGPVTNTAVAVTNGLFTTTMDFGNVFTGNKAWLELGVRTNGNGVFATLNPRQQLTPTPYAIFANAASNAAALNGQSSSAFAAASGSAGYIQNQNSGAQAANYWINGAARAASFVGDGSGLTHVPPVAASAPASPSTGQFYYDTTVKSLMVYDGSGWKPVGPPQISYTTFFASETHDVSSTNAAPIATSRTLTFTKLSSSTRLRITYFDDFGVVSISPGVASAAWEIKVDGFSFALPLKMYLYLVNNAAQAIESQTATVTGIESGISAGSHTLTVLVSSYYTPTTHAYNGDGGSAGLLEVEEIP